MGRSKLTMVEGRHGSFVAAPTALSDTEVAERFGPVMRRAMESFSRDASYLVEMANSARTIERRRARRG